MSGSFTDAAARPETALETGLSTAGTATDKLDVPDTPAALFATSAPEVGTRTPEPAPLAATRSYDTPPAKKRGRGMMIALVIGTALVMLAAGIGIGYASGAGTRSDLSAAQAQVDTLNGKVATLTASNTAASAASATNAARAAACQTAMTASNQLTAQWANLWDDLDRAMSASSASAMNAVFAHMDAQYTAMMQAQGRVNTLMQQCTGSAS